ncbi:MAG: glycosyltransferase family 4 protein [Parcubacteria group bacterium]
MNNDVNEVLIVGPLPPPCGGISTHIARLFDHLTNNGFICALLNTSLLYNKMKIRFSALDWWDIFHKIVSFKGNIIHFHVSAMNNFYVFLLLFILISNEVKKIITIHSGDFINHYLKTNVIKRLAIKMILRKCEHIIIVNVEQMEFLREKIKISPNRMTVQSAFLPPALGAEKVNEAIEATIAKLRGKVKKIALVSGIPTENYNFPFVLDIYRRLKQQNADLGLIFAFYGLADEEMFNCPVVQKATATEDVAVFNNLDQDRFIELLQSVDIYIRPTNYDGASIAVREAIYLKKQIIASDSVARPAGILIFKNRNAEDLQEKILNAINDDRLGVSTYNLINGGDTIINIYNNLLTQ